MAARLSRVSIVVKDRTGAESQGSLSAAVGFALHQTWVYVTVFSGAGVFSESPFFQWENFSWLPMPLVFFASSVALVVLMLAAGLFAQKAADVLVRMPVVAGAAAVSFAGSDAPDAAARYDDALKEACERIASRYLLSQRQTEVLYLLARGHTAPCIQDKLCVTLSTAKSHIHNIYKKLDIHKQHELLSMVEAEIEGRE